jgi:hypothetical protein
MNIKKLVILYYIQLILYVFLIISFITCLDIVSQCTYDNAWKTLIQLEKNNKHIISLKSAEKTYGGDYQDGVFRGDDLFCGNKGYNIHSKTLFNLSFYQL